MSDDLIEKLMSQVGDDVQKIYDHEALFKAAAARILEQQAEIKALREGRGVKVKPLIFEEAKQHTIWSSGHVVGGEYRIINTGQGFVVKRGMVCVSDGTRNIWDKFQEAEKASQADYERRILSALSPAPVSVGEDDLRDAFIAGATAVHFQWQEQYHDGIPPPRHTDFYEAADDYATAALRALSEGEG